MKGIKIYRRTLLVVIILISGVILLLLYHNFEKAIPRQLKIIEGKEALFNFGVPASGSIYEESVETMSQQVQTVSLAKQFRLKSDKTGNYIMKVKLFGFLDVKKVAVSVVSDRYVYASGEPVGIYIKTKGAMIIGTAKVEGKDGVEEPAKNLVLPGDYIKKIGKTRIHNKSQVISEINNGTGKSVTLTIQRNGEDIKVRIKPVQTVTGYKLGIWLRDDTQGIGTMTYLEKNKFGALGHGIRDVDTGKLMDTSEGEIYETSLSAVVKGKSGTPGELIGSISYEKKDYLGVINKNTSCGIFGEIINGLEQYQKGQPVEIATKQEIEEGKAYIQSSIEGESKQYEIEIEKIDISGDEPNKGMEIHVTDSRLLELTGGIVQGMSGSPIIQDGKLIGAVTHVFVNDPTRGYGIFAEKMLEQE